MILLDTHIWIWWVTGSPALTPAHGRLLQENESVGIGVSVISCWEVAMLIARKRLVVDRPVQDWIDQALAYPGVELIALTARMAVDSVQLPGDLHRDPADRILVATAHALACPLLTADDRLLRYPHVQAVGPGA